MLEFHFHFGPGFSVQLDSRGTTVSDSFVARRYGDKQSRKKERKSH